MGSATRCLKPPGADIGLANTNKNGHEVTRTPDTCMNGRFFNFAFRNPSWNAASPIAGRPGSLNSAISLAKRPSSGNPLRGDKSLPIAYLRAEDVLNELASFFHFWHG
jgi:hypothetical protein